MSKDELIDAVVKQVSSLGLNVSCGGQADIVVHMEFESKAWPLGKKSIIYDALIWINDCSAIVSMWEKTVETSSGLSIKAESETYSQKGKSLQRRIKGTFLGPDGQKRTYDFNLGAVSNSIRELATRNGWIYVAK